MGVPTIGSNRLFFAIFILSFFSISIFFSIFSFFSRLSDDCCDSNSSILSVADSSALSSSSSSCLSLSLSLSSSSLSLSCESCPRNSGGRVRMESSLESSEYRAGMSSCLEVSTSLW